MAQRNNDLNTKTSGVLRDWLLPLIFLFFLPPVGVLLVVAKLLGSDKKSKQQIHARQSNDSQAPVAPGSRTTMSYAASAQARQEAAAHKEPAALSSLARRIKKLSTAGAILTFLFGFTSLMILTENFWMLPDVLWLLEELLAPLCITFGGMGMWFAGSRQKKKLRRFRQYLAMIGQNETISISSLASATGRPAQEVREDLQEMLDEGCFPTGFLDYGGDTLVLSNSGLTQQSKKAPKQDVKTIEEAENAVLAEIKAVNDSITNPVLSVQIDRIGIITAKIFDFQKSHPEHSPQLHSFLSYYLPTTLKILRAYAKLEAQGIEGENITAAKQRIEGMMDKVVEGFEKQLDQLFQGESLDISTDVKVLEQMLAKDGLSSGGLRLGI